MPSGPSKRSIEVRVFPTFRSTVKAPFVRKAAIAALASADPGGTTDLSVVIADEETLRDLNLRFRGFDEPTDVLSFGDEGDASLTSPDAERGPAFPDPPEGTPVQASCTELVRAGCAHRIP